MSISNQENIPAVEVVSSNSSLIVADSRYGKALDTLPNGAYIDPSEFICELSQGLNKIIRVQHRTLMWSQALYTHTPFDNQIHMYFQGGDPNGVYMRLTPWLVFNYFAGQVEDEQSFAVPQVETYCWELEEALHNPYTGFNASGNLTGVPGVVDLNGAAALRVRYKPGVGIYLYTTDPLIPFRIGNDSQWLNEGHFVHGIGTLQPNGSFGVNANDFVQSYSSSTIPTLALTRYIVINSREINFNRKVSSLTNVITGAFSQSEVNIFEIKKERIGRPTILTIEADPTSVNVDPLANTQQIVIFIRDEFGYRMRGYYPTELYDYVANDFYTIPPATNWTANRILFASLYGPENPVYTRVSMPRMLPDPVVHIFQTYTV